MNKDTLGLLVLLWMLVGAIPSIYVACIADSWGWLFGILIYFIPPFALSILSASFPSWRDEADENTVYNPQHNHKNRTFSIKFFCPNCETEFKDTFGKRDNVYETQEDDCYAPRGGVYLNPKKMRIVYIGEYTSAKVLMCPICGNYKNLRIVSRESLQATPE